MCPFVVIGWLLCLVQTVVRAQLEENVIKSLRVVALGDSYIAGNGARAADGSRNYEDSTCYRSNTNWVGLYRDCLQTSLPADFPETFKVQFTNEACSGARIADVPAQVERGVNKNTDIVFLSITGNDFNFRDVLISCYYSKITDDCEELLTEGRNKIEEVRPLLVELLLSIRQKARPDTKVVLVGYPYMSLDIDYNLWDFELPFGDDPVFSTYPAAAEIRAAGDVLDAMQQEAVALANQAAEGEAFAFFENIKTLFAGREPDPRLGIGNPDGWIYELQPYDTFGYFAENFHYTATGHQELGMYLCNKSRDYGAGRLIESGTGGDDVDLVFVIDTTGSMGDDIAAAQASATAILSKLAGKTTSLRVGLVEYRDFGDFPGGAAARVVQSFTEDIGAVQTGLDGLTADGGGDTPEAVWSGLFLAFGLGWRDAVKKLAIQFGDAPALNPERITGYTTQDVIDASLAIDPVIVSAVDTGSAGSEIRAVAEATNGEVLMGSSETIAERIEELVDATLDAPFAWVGSRYVGFTGLAVRFDGAGSYARMGKLVQYEWDIDNDGTYDALSSEPFYDHTYTADYNGLVLLRVTDDLGSTALATGLVNVTTDGDGVKFADDNCPDDYNPDQKDSLFLIHPCSHQLLRLRLLEQEIFLSSQCRHLMLL
jgi:lysophospholipase L1-like esterase